MCTILKLENSIREYAWGSKTAFSALFNKRELAGNPQAELWMGAHPIASSMAILGDRKASLIDLIKQNPVDFLGAHVAAKFDNTLPFLFKILAAEKPLSIQAHPDKIQAETGFKREEKAGIPITSPDRVYRDMNHKPEIICALTPFWALCGFRPYSDICNSFKSVSNKTVAAGVNAFSKSQSEAGLKLFYNFIMMLDNSTTRGLIKEILDTNAAGPMMDNRYKWMVNVQNDYPFDIGILSFLFLNIIELKPQEALYLPARKLHSYLSGIGIELMANSDNVVRGGLTEKHVDVPELISILNFASGLPEVLHAKKSALYEETYASEPGEFVLSRISLSMQEYRPSLLERNVEIIVVVDGNGSIKDSSRNTQISLQRGDSCIIPAAVNDYSIEGKLTLYKATVPMKRSLHFAI